MISDSTLDTLADTLMDLDPSWSGVRVYTIAPEGDSDIYIDYRYVEDAVDFDVESADQTLGSALSSVLGEEGVDWKMVAQDGYGSPTTKGATYWIRVRVLD